MHPRGYERGMTREQAIGVVLVCAFVLALVVAAALAVGATV
jgi:hypothetical protein